MEKRHKSSGWENPDNQVFLRYGGDGVADLITGGAFLGIGLMMLSDLPFVPVWILIVLMPISWGLKRLITVPRLSEKEISGQIDRNGLPTKAIKWAAAAGVIILSGVVLLTAFSEGSLITFLGQYAYWILIGLSLIVILTALGLIYGSLRWMTYALLVLPLFIFGALLGVDFPLILAALGGIILTGGLITASRFVASHPLLDSK